MTKITFKFIKIIKMMLAIFVLLTSARNVDAATINYLTNPGPSLNKLYFAPPNYNGSLYGSVGLLGPTPFWYIAQWNIPVMLSGTAIPTGVGYGWYTDDPYARVLRYDDTNKSLELAQNGATTNLTCGTEFDLFLSPVDSSYSSYNQGIIQGPSLNTLTSLRYTLGSKITYEYIAIRCPVNYAYYTAVIVFSNPTTQQVIFYQIILRDSWQGYANYACSPSTYWFSTNGPFFGVNDTAPVLGQSCLPASGILYNYSFEIASRIKTLIIQGAKYYIDQDLGHWFVSGLYIGSGLEGSATVTSIYSSINLVGAQ